MREFGKIETLRELWRVTLEDVRKTERDARFTWDMAVYVRPSKGRGPCAVCLAGAVCVQRLGVSGDTGIISNPALWFGQEVATRLRAIDNLRCGAIVTALALLTQSIVPSEHRAWKAQEAFCESRNTFSKDWGATPFWPLLERMQEVLDAFEL